MTVEMTPEGENVSLGVQALIEKLRDQGVQTGRKQGKNIVDEAQIQAKQLLDEARKKAEIIVSEAREEAHFISSAGNEALELAFRNIILKLQGFFSDQFADQIQSVVQEKLNDKDLLGQMIIEMVGDNELRNEKEVTVLLPQSTLNNQANAKESINNKLIMSFVKEQASILLKKGVQFKVGAQHQTGLNFCLRDKKVEVELSTETISSMLLQYLQPRFKALLEGNIK